MTAAAHSDAALQNTIQQTATLLNNMNNEHTNSSQHNTVNNQSIDGSSPSLYIVPPIPNFVIPTQSPTSTATPSPNSKSISPNNKTKKSPKNTPDVIPTINPADYPNIDPEILARMSPAELKRCFRAPQKQRRSSNQLDIKERWYCSNGCGVAYKNTSTKSIKSHQLECIYNGPNRIMDTIKSESDITVKQEPNKKKRVDASAAEALLSLTSSSPSNDTSTVPATSTTNHSTVIPSVASVVTDAASNNIKAEIATRTNSTNTAPTTSNSNTAPQPTTNLNINPVNGGNTNMLGSTADNNKSVIASQSATSTTVDSNTNTPTTPVATRDGDDTST